MLGFKYAVGMTGFEDEEWLFKTKTAPQSPQDSGSFCFQRTQAAQKLRISLLCSDAVMLSPR